MSMLTRRDFIKKMAIGVSGLLAIVGFKAIVSSQSVHQKKSVVVELPLPEGYSIHGDVLIFKQGKKYSAFVNRCTHLGCSFRNVVADGIECPCHGSKFGDDGVVTRGPAKDRLVSLPTKVMEAEKRLLVEIKNQS